ncbi:MAG: cyclase family protein [Candidatus Nitrosopolaris sp.]
MNNIEKKRNNTNAITISRTFYYDLTHLITQEMPVYPGDPMPEFKPIATIEKQKVNVTRIVIGSHTGTHVDAQKHFIANGNSIDKEPLDKFMGEAVTLDISNINIGDGITGSDLENYSKVVKHKDILLLYTGTSDKWTKDDSIRNNFTYLEPSAADWIVDHKIKCVGIDTLSMEKYGFKEGLTHKKLLSNGIGIIENLNSSLKKIISMRTFLICMPLPLEGVDGTPARAVAFAIP